MRSTLLIAALAGVSTLASAASAQVASPDIDPANEENTGGRVYIRAGAGINFGARLEQDVALDPATTFPVIEPVPTPVSGLETDYASGAQGTAAIGFAYPAGTRTELEYRYVSLGVDAISSVPDMSVGIDIADPERLRAHFLMSNVYYDFRNNSALTPFIGVGVGGAFVTDSFGQQDAGFAYQARAGLALALSDSLSVDVEYLYARTRALRFGTDEFSTDGVPDLAIQPARIDGDGLATSSVMASLRLTF